MGAQRFAVFVFAVWLLVVPLFRVVGSSGVGVYHGVLPEGWFEVTTPAETSGLLMYVTDVPATGSTDVDVQSSRLINWTSIGGGAVKAYAATKSDFISGSWTYLAYNPKATQSDIDNYNAGGWRNYITEFTFKNDYALYYVYYPDDGFEQLEYYWVDAGLGGGSGVVLEAAISDPAKKGFDVYQAGVDAVMAGITFDSGGSTQGVGAASFTVSGLTIEPSRISEGDKATISVAVNNVGDADGACTINLRVNGGVVSTKSVDVAAGGSKTTSWTTSDQWKAGTYEVDVEGLTGTLTVAAPGGIPGYPYESIIVGLIVGVAIFALYRRRA